MKQAILVLQYPDEALGRTRALAATRNIMAMRAFKDAVLEDAKLELLGCEDDDVLRLERQLEVDRLRQLFDLLLKGPGISWSKGETIKVRDDDRGS